MGTVFLLAFIAFVLSLVSPESILPIFKGRLQKKGMRWLFGSLVVVSLMLVGDSPKSAQETSKIQTQEITQAVSPEIQEEKESVADESNPVPEIEIKEEIKKESIPFETKTKNDSTLDKGVTKTIQEGSLGEKEFTYKVTYTDGKETDRELISESIKTQPKNKIVSIGTKEFQPVYVAPASCGEDYYRNVDGNCVHRPSDNPSGASAKCRDGSYSYSQNRRGTCSGHGGVAAWY